MADVRQMKKDLAKKAGGPSPPGPEWDTHMNKQRLHTRYRLADGTIVPGVTTILQGWGFGSAGLLAWQRKLMERGVDPDMVRDEAAAIGSLTHQLIEDWWNSTSSDISQNGMDQYALAEAGFRNFAHWARGSGLSMVATECQVVSERHRFGGSVDLIALQDTGEGSKRVLIDYKTSKAILPVHKMQVAAYKCGWDESHPEEAIDRVVIVKVGRSAGQLAAYTLSSQEYDVALSAFLELRRLYDAEKVL